MANKRKKVVEQHTAVNRRTIAGLVVFGFYMCLFGCLACLAFYSEMNMVQCVGVALICFLGAVGFASCLVLGSAYYIFSSDKIVAVKLFGHKKEILWENVDKVYEYRYGKFYRDSWPKYEIVYKAADSTLKNIYVPMNKKTKTLFMNFARSKLAEGKQNKNNLVDDKYKDRFRSDKKR